MYFATLRQERHCVERRTRTIFDQGHQATSEVHSRELSGTGSEASTEPASPSLSPQIVILRGVGPLSRQTSAGSYRPFRPSPRCTLSDVLVISIDHSLGVGHPDLSVTRLQEAHLLEKARFLRVSTKSAARRSRSRPKTIKREPRRSSPES